MARRGRAENGSRHDSHVNSIGVETHTRFFTCQVTRKNIPQPSLSLDENLDSLVSTPSSSTLVECKPYTVLCDR
jgi:hypothetical protein